jgi:hypothetical protein
MQQDLIASRSIFKTLAGPPLDTIPVYVKPKTLEATDPYTNGLNAVQQNAHAYNGLPDEVKLIPDVACAFVSKSPHAFFRLAPQLQQDRDVVWYAVKKDPSVLGNKSMPDAFRGDAALVTCGLLRTAYYKGPMPTLEWLGNVDWDVLGDESFLLGLKRRVNSYYSSYQLATHILCKVARMVPLSVFKNDAIAAQYFGNVESHALLVQIYTGNLSDALKRSASILKVLHGKDLLTEEHAPGGSPLCLLSSVPTGTFLDKESMIALFAMEPKCVYLFGQRLWTDESFVRDLINVGVERHTRVDLEPVLRRVSIDILNNPSSFMRSVLDPMTNSGLRRSFADTIHDWIAPRVTSAEVLYKVADVINANMTAYHLLDEVINATKKLLSDAVTATEFFNRLGCTHISDRQFKTIIGYLGQPHIPLPMALAIVAASNDYSYDSVSSSTVSLVLSRIDPHDMNRMCLLLENYDFVENKAPDEYRDDDTLTTLCNALFDWRGRPNSACGTKLEDYEKSETDPHEINTEEKELQFKRRHFLNMLLKGRGVDSRVRIVKTFMKKWEGAGIWWKVGRTDVWDHSASLRLEAMLSGTSDSHTVYWKKATETERNDVGLVLRMMLHPNAERARKGQCSAYAREIAQRVPPAVRNDVGFARMSILYFGKVLTSSECHMHAAEDSGENSGGESDDADEPVAATIDNLSWQVEKKLLEIAHANHHMLSNKAKPHLSWLRSFFHDLWMYDVTSAESEFKCLSRKRSMKPKDYTMVLPESYAITTIEERKKHADMLSTWMAAINEICRDIHTKEDVVADEKTGSQRIRRSVVPGGGVRASPAITTLANRIYTFMARESGQVTVMDVMCDLFEEADVTEEAFVAEQTRVAKTSCLQKRMQKQPKAPVKRLRVEGAEGPSTSTGNPLDSDDDDE